jgi:hypothetical protein
LPWATSASGAVGSGTSTFGGVPRTAREAADEAEAPASGLADAATARGADGLVGTERCDRRRPSCGGLAFGSATMCMPARDGDSTETDGRLPSASILAITGSATADGAVDSIRRGTSSGVVTLVGWG